MRFPALASPIGGLSLATLALHHLRIVDHGIRIDRVPALAWLVLQAAALWPTWHCMAARMRNRKLLLNLLRFRPLRKLHLLR